MSSLDIANVIASCPPFSFLSSLHLEEITQSVDIAYYKKDAIILQPQQACEYYYLIAKGVICEQVENEENYLGAKEGFDFGAILQGSTKYRYYAYEESIIYLIPQATIRAIMAKSPAFADYFLQSTVKKFETLSNHNTHSALTLQIATITLQKNIIVDESTPLFDVVKLMDDERRNAILVHYHDNDYGIITDSNIRKAILSHYDFALPCAYHAHKGLISIDNNDFVLNAVLLMTKYNIKRLVVKENGNVRGLLNEMDVVSALSNQTQFLALKIEKANTLDEIISLSHEVVNVVKSLFKEGVKSRYITKLVTELNLKVYEKIFRFLAPQEIYDNCALIVMGSEARGEQVLKTDQDNALIIADGFSHPQLHEVCQLFNESLVKAGFPLCEGNIMVSNEFWRLHLHDYKIRLFDWVNTPSAESFLHYATMCDMRFVCGQENLFHELKTYLLKVTLEQQRFLSAFARPIRDFETPMTFFKTFVLGKGEHKDEFDIKKGAIFPLIHGMRVFALELGIEETNTFERIKALNNKEIIDRQFAQELIESLEFFFTLRLGAKLKQKERNKELHDNYINPKELTPFERDLLKEGFKVVDKFKALVASHFKLDYFG